MNSYRIIFILLIRNYRVTGRIRPNTSRLFENVSFSPSVTQLELHRSTNRCTARDRELEHSNNIKPENQKPRKA